MKPAAAQQVWAQLQPADRQWLSELAALAGPAAQVALVGGAVRDALLGVTPLDLHVVVEGADVEELARQRACPCLSPGLSECHRGTPGRKIR